MILRRGGKNTQKNCTNPDNHSGVITHLEPDILECEVMWVLESITMKKAGGIPSPPPAFFIVMLSKTHMTSHSRMSGSR